MAPTWRRTLAPRQNPTPTSYYSHGIVVGPVLYTSGQTSRDISGNIVGLGSSGEQTAQALRNLSNVLQEAQLSVEDVVALRVFLCPQAALDEVTRALGQFLGSHSPAITFVMVKGLAYEEYLVEVEAVAFANTHSSASCDA